MIKAIGLAVIFALVAAYSADRAVVQIKTALAYIGKDRTKEPKER